MRGLSTLIALFGFSMLTPHPAPSQLFISLNGMPSLRHLPVALQEPHYRAGARALRVGMIPIVQHAYYGVNMLTWCHLQTLHAEPVRGDWAC